jgi:demethylmenaquinone methyltransferase / 2-methoxy-6-polyprenyl-1,4-benzoquinol methylase
MGFKDPDPKIRKGDDVRGMFSKIAPKYDILNHLLSLNFDKRWRKKAVEHFEAKENETYLDLCCGTGDFGIELKNRQNTNVIGADFSLEMLKIAAKKTSQICYISGDALKLPFKESVFSGAMVGFGIRNFEDLEAGLKEANRVLKPGAKFVILEFPRKVTGFFGPLFNFYFKNILPLIGRMISKDNFAYTYLPESTKHFPGEAELKELLRECGFEIVSFKKRTMGIVFEAVGIRK